VSIPELPSLIYEPIIRSALLEDLGRAGDLTSDAVVPASATCEGRIVARRDGRVAGVGIAAAVFRTLDAGLEIDLCAGDGADVSSGEVLLRVSGRARAVLSAERTALNLLGRLSGVATLTRAYVDAVAGTRARIVCTRKTTPGLRALEKYAVRCGGGANHRFGLDDAMLVKDNHIAIAGSVRAAIERARAAVGHMVVVEVEVDTLDQLEEVLELGVDAVLLDNLDLETLRRAVAMVAGRMVTEASGGLALDRVGAVAATGVDLVSVGALTHSAPALDVSLEVTR
jgi:nicotinate-nucleotide pyrophosphorylase (carboxylating)